MAASDFFRERPGAPQSVLFTRSSRTASGFALFGALAVPLFVVAMGYFAYHILAGLGAGLVIYLALFRSMTREAFVRLWTFESIRILPAERELIWSSRRPFGRTDERIPFAKIRRLLEITSGAAGRSESRSQVLLVLKDRKDVDLGSGPGARGGPLAARLALLTGAPHEVERAPDPIPFPEDRSSGDRGTP